VGGANQSAPRWRRLALPIALLALAFAIRLLYALWYDHTYDASGDARYYHLQANALADGAFYVEPFQYAAGAGEVASAYHPPLYPTLLAVPSVLGATSELAHRLVGVVLGTFTCGVLGACGALIGGRRPALLTLLLAAVFPPLWIVDGLLMSETAFAATAAVTVLAWLHYARAPSFRRALLVGGAIALMTLTRAEAAIVLVCFAVTVAVSRSDGIRERSRRLAAALVAFVALLAPWVTFNLVRFDDPTFVSTGLGSLLVVSNCSKTYGGEWVGAWQIGCYDELGLADTRDLNVLNAERADDVVDDIAVQRERYGDESEQEHAYRTAANRFIRDHVRSLPRVAFFRLGRTFEWFHPDEIVNYNAAIEGRGEAPSRAAQLAWFAAVPLVAIGVVHHVRRRLPLAPFVAMFALVVVTTIIGYGNVRFRTPFDVVVPVLAASGIMAVAGDRGARSQSARW
jgi:4-amino-4-deoxy-L-arabinose transferase-like glycosyltransferase